MLAHALHDILRDDVRTKEAHKIFNQRGASPPIIIHIISCVLWANAQWCSCMGSK